MSTITRRINQLLDRNSVTEGDLRSVVEEYESELASVNRRLAEASDLVRRGRRDEAMALVGSSPSLIEQANHLVLPRRDELLELLVIYNLPPVNPVDTKSLKMLREATVNKLHWTTLLLVGVTTTVCAVPVVLLIAAVFWNVSFLHDNSNDLLAELNASAGIKNIPKDQTSQSSEPEQNTTPEIEASMAGGTAAESDDEGETTPEADAAKAKKKEEQDEIERQGAIKKLEELAKTILDDGQTFLADKGERSIKALVTDTENELKLLEEKKRQLETFSLEPSDEDLSQWVRSDNWQQEPENFMTPKRKDVEALREHTATKVLDDRQKNLLRVLEDWDTSAKEWEKVQKNEPDLVSSVSGNEDVDQTIVNVRSLATASLGDAFKTSLDRHKAISADLPTIAEKLKNQFGPKKDQLVTDLKRRRDSHRLKIYFDGDFNRRENPLQIKPRCYIAINDEDLQATKQLRVDGGTIPFSTSGPAKLPGRFEGWLSINRGKRGVVLQLTPGSIPENIAADYRLLNQLKAFVEQQEWTIVSAARLKSLTELNSKGDRLSDFLKAIRDPFHSSKSIPETLDEMYLDAGDETIAGFEKLQTSIADAFDEDDRRIGPRINEHLHNLRKLQADYVSLKESLMAFDLGGHLVFGSSASSAVGQTSFKPLETFELFFIPELVFGPPPDE